MKARRLWSLPLSIAGGLVLATGVAVAQPSSTAGLINDLNRRLLVIAIPITLLVEGILLYTVIRYRNADDPEPTKENRRLEITWTVATAVILLFVGVASYGVLANEDVTYTGAEAAPDGDPVRVETVAYQWGWRMNYPEQNISELDSSMTDVINTEDRTPIIVLPVDRPVLITVTSEDVIHALHVPQLGLKQDAIPGQENTIRTTPLETGVYQGYCAEFCGSGHSKMNFKVVVVSGDRYEAFLANQQQAANETATTGANTTTTAGVPAGR